VISMLWGFGHFYRMSKFKCACGEVIYDQTDHLPYKGHLFADVDYFEIFNRISTDLAGYTQARKAGTERPWLTDYFGVEHAKDTAINDEDLIFTIIARQLPRRNVYQCRKCGRLHVERNDDRMRLTSFVPDGSPHLDIFHK
jgi:hypothetical protein